MIEVNRVIQARNFTRGPRRAPPRLIVLHTMEAPEKIETALAVARWFAGVAAPQASAHYCIDRDETIQCVSPEDIAWHAPGANSDGIGIEHAGYAKQSESDWSDPYSLAMLERSARLVAQLCDTYSLPVEFVDKAGLLAGATGITTHAAVSFAYRKSTHTDPGPRFPMAWYLDRVREQMALCAEA